MTVSDQQIFIGASTPDDLRSLFGWLQREDALRGRVTSRNGPVRPGEMGGALDAITVAVGSGGVGAVLAGCLSTWISLRRSEVKITVVAADGRRIEVDAKRVDARSLTQDIERLLDAGRAP